MKAARSGFHFTFISVALLRTLKFHKTANLHERSRQKR